VPNSLQGALRRAFFVEPDFLWREIPYVGISQFGIPF
jgi:hypothetical protein